MFNLKKILSGVTALTLGAGTITTATAWTVQKLPQQTKPTTFKRDTSIAGNVKVRTITQFHNIIYAKTFAGMLYQATDGKHFTQNTTIPASVIVRQITTIDNIVYVSTMQGLYQSTDGIHFTQNPSIPGRGGVMQVVQIQNIINVITLFNGLYQSTDNGQTFHQNTTIPLAVDPLKNSAS